MCMEYESRFNSLLVDCHQMLTSGAWSSLKRIVEYFTHQLTVELNTLSFSPENDRQRLILEIEIRALNKLLTDIDSFASQYIERERNK